VHGHQGPFIASSHLCGRPVGIARASFP